MKIFGSAAQAGYHIQINSRAKSTSPAAVSTPAAADAEELSSTPPAASAVYRYAPIQPNREDTGSGPAFSASAASCSSFSGVGGCRTDTSICAAVFGL